MAFKHRRRTERLTQATIVQDMEIHVLLLGFDISVRQNWVIFLRECAGLVLSVLSVCLVCVLSVCA